VNQEHRSNVAGLFDIQVGKRKTTADAGCENDDDDILLVRQGGSLSKSNCTQLQEMKEIPEIIQVLINPFSVECVLIYLDFLEWFYIVRAFVQRLSLYCGSLRTMSDMRLCTIDF
jgi:hypothetical protein